MSARGDGAREIMTNQKKEYGQYMTVDTIANFMVSLIQHPKNSTILEPSCGTGVFLDKLVEQNYNNITAYEIDESLNKKHNFIQYKSFLSVPLDDKFDVVIGNPPYIRWKNLDTTLKNELLDNELWNKYFNSLCDYLFIFILKSIEHLNIGGELIFITTDYWLTSTHSLSLRDYMCRYGHFEQIYRFNEIQLFENVTASFIIFRFVKDCDENTVINTTICKRPEYLHLYTYNLNIFPRLEDLYSKTCFNLEVIPQFQQNKRWILAPENIQKQLTMFEYNCRKSDKNISDLYRIGDFCNICNGMVSGLDKAFQITNIDNLNTIESKALINVIKAKNIRQYSYTDVTKYIFLQENISEESFKLYYPNFYKHFFPNINKLKCRYNFNKSIPYWQFAFPRNQKHFETNEPRIFAPCKERISNKKYFRFCYVPQNIYPTQDVTAIFRKPSCKEAIEYVVAYLNNDRIFNWLRFNGIVKGAIVEFSEKPIANIPYRPINWTNQIEVNLHNKIVSEVKNYIQDDCSEHIKNINSLFNELFLK